jgi:hypothetical protein
MDFGSLAMAMQLASSGVSALSTLTQGQVDQYTGAYNAGILNYRAQLALVQQKWAFANMDVIRQQAEIKKRALTKEYKKIVGDIRTVKGITSTSPTILAAIEDSAKEYLYDLALVDWDAELQAIGEARAGWAKGVEAEGYKYDAKYQRYMGEVKRRSSYAKAGASLLLGGAQLASYMARRGTPSLGSSSTWSPGITQRPSDWYNWKIG